MSRGIDLSDAQQIPHRQKDAGSEWQMYWLGGYLRQNVHALNFGRDAEGGTCSLLYAQDAGVAADPALLTGGQLWRQDENQLDVRAFRHAGVGIEKYAIRADIASLGAQFGIRGIVANPHRQLGDDSFARAAVGIRSH
jgi:hypothetical protein